jgi:HlyD family secretion protein
VNPRNRFFILLGIIFLIALGYYFFSTPSNKDLVLIGTVDSNQVIVSPQTQGRLQKLLVDEGTPVKAGQLIAVIDPAELRRRLRRLQNILNLRSKVSSMRYRAVSARLDQRDVANAQAKLRSMTSQLAQAQAALERTQSDSRRMIELAKQGVASDQERVQAETNLTAAKANVQSLKDQVTAAEADLNAAIARTHQANAAQSTVASTRADLKNAEEQKRQAEVRLGYTNIYAPVTGTVSVRAAVRRGAERRPAHRDHRRSSDTWVRRRFQRPRPTTSAWATRCAPAGRHDDKRQGIFKAAKQISRRSATSTGASATSRRLC